MFTAELVWLRERLVTGQARQIRAAARLSASDVARELGVSPSAVSRWERADRMPSGLHALRYAAFLRRLAQ